MIGNAVNVTFAKILAESIFSALASSEKNSIQKAS